MGEVPHWYRVMKSAQYLRVAPWELAAQPLEYLLQAEAARAAEHKAQKRKEGQNSRK